MPTERWICVFGGTFDPVHRGHLGLASDLRDAMVSAGRDATVHVIPCHKPPHRDQPSATGQQRLDMLRLAIPEAGGLVVDDRELRSDRVSYTVDTLVSLKETFPTAKLLLAVGQDAFAGFDRWHDWRTILELAALIVCSRPGADQSGPTALADCPRKSLAEIASAGEIAHLDIEPVDISSSEIRQRIASGRDVGHCLPSAVARYIEAHRLYR